ncbi:MAG: hypothetical protein GOU98_00275 [Candidatus Altiarchaeota archaeon]|nr:hypothetical protein [Candidatus Altiarchaeota archaeon]
MRKSLVLILLLLPVLSLNITVQCDSNCYTYIPVNGYGYINYTVNGSLLEDVYRSATLINVTGTNLSTLMIFNLADYGCSNPSDLFLNQSPVEAAFFEDLLVAEYDLDGVNTTFKLFCDGSNDLRSQASWYNKISVTSIFSQDNLTFIDGKYVLTGLTLDASVEFSGPVRAIERTYGNVTIGEVELSVLNISSYDNSLVWQDNIELPYSDYVYLDFANLTGDDERFFVVSHGNVTWGNITILNEDLDINASLGFNLTKGVAITDYDGDSENEIVACINKTTTFNLTTFEFIGTWANTTSNINCESFGSFDPISYPDTNGSIVTYNSTSLIWIVFNTTTTVYTKSWANIKDVASIDLDADTYSEILITTTDGEVNAYEVTDLFTTQHLDYFGKHKNDFIDASSDILTYNGSLNLYSGNYLTNKGELNYTQTSILAPIKISLNFSVGGSGDATLSTALWESTGENYWYFSQTYTQGFHQVELYPQQNGSLTINFTLSGVNASYDSWIKVDSLLVHNVSLDFVNFSDYQNYTLSAIPINTTILSDNLNIVGANFSDSYYLNYIVAFFGIGNHSVQLDAPEYSISLSKPSLGVSSASYFVNATSAIQPSQSEGNFSSIAGFSNILRLVTQGVSVSTYGTVNDYCSFGKYLVYTYGNATLLSWNGQVDEVGNLTGNFTGCWLNDDRIYLVNSTGGIDIFDFSLVRVGNFSNSSFIVQDIVVINDIYGWNGTHTARLEYNSSFDSKNLWSDNIYGLQHKYHSLNTTGISDKPGFDLALDGLWDFVSSGVYSAISNFIRIFTTPISIVTGFNSEIMAFFDNGTIEASVLNLSKPTIGTFNFTPNVTYDVPGNWISFDSAGYYLINLSADGYFEDETDTLSSFSMTCKNSTYEKEMFFAKESNHTFILINNSFSGKYECNLIPTWEVSLPTTFTSKTFTAYSDSDTPVINNATSTIYISEDQAFNMTLNVTEDSEIKLITVYAIQGPASASIIDSDLSGEFQIYNLSVTFYPTPNIPPVIESNFTLGVEDYTGKVSANFTTQNFTVYDSTPPVITIIDSLPGNNIQDFSDVPLNLSIQVSSGDANISWINVTLWDAGVLLNYTNITDVNNDTHILWLNQSLTAQQDNYEVRVTTADIADTLRSATFDITRYGKNSRTLDGKWYSDVKLVEYYWTNELSSQNVDDIDTIRETNTSSVFEIEIDAPDRPVDEWWVFANQSDGTGLKSIKMKYGGSEVSSVTQDLTSTLYLFGVNTSDAPDTIILDAQRTVGAAEKMCLMICNDFDVAESTCGSTWAEKTCAAADDDENIFTVAGGDPLIVDIDSGGVGFRIDSVAITSGDDGDSSSSSSGDDTTVVTSTAGSAVVTISAPSSKTVDVGSCVDVEYSIANTGSVSGSISGISVLNVDTDEITFTVLSDISYPYNLGVSKILKTILSFCPLKPGDYNPRVCAKIGTTNKCISVKITGEGDEVTIPTGPLEMEVSVETFDDEYIIFVNSTIGPIEGATVTVVYTDGTNETFTTNVFGKVNFEPKIKDFTVTVDYGEDSITKEVEEILEKVGFTVWRILLSFLIVGALIGFGVVLDEKMM